MNDFVVVLQMPAGIERGDKPADDKSSDAPK